MEWDKIALDISKAITLDTKVSKRALMLKLLSSINELIFEYTEKKDVTRIWTLHKIRGSQVIFYDSDERAEPAQRSKYRNITEGLIGKTIQSEKDYKIFNNTPDIGGVIVGWEKCASELIVLVRDRIDKPIAIINIESDFEEDFTPDNEEDNIKFNGELSKLLRLFSNHISVVFELEGTIRSSDSASNILKSISSTKLETRHDLINSLSSTFTWISKRCGLIRTFLIMKDDEYIENSTLRASLFHIHNHLSFPEYENDDLIDSMSITKNIEIYSKFPTKCSENDLEDVFPNKINQMITIEGYQTVNYLQLYKISKKNTNKDTSVILLSIYDKRNKVTLDKLEDMFDIIISQLTFYLNYKKMKYQYLITESITFLNNSAFSNEYMSSILNDISSYVATKTHSSLCMIYLLVHEEQTHEEMKFFLGGSGGDISVELTEKRLPAETIIGEMIKKDNSLFYSNDYYNCDENSNILDKDLKSAGLLQPSIFSHLLYAKKRRPIGAIILFKENIDSQNIENSSLDHQNIKNYITDLSFHIGNIIQSKTLYYIDEILSKTYRSFFEEKIMEKKPSIKNKIDEFQYKINLVIKKALSPISEPIFFAIYKRDGKKFKQLSNAGLREDLNLEPPIFELNDGLTGSVMFQPSGEIFVPYVEDIKIDIENSPQPAIQCRNYWDYLIGDYHRFYYGKHFRINSNQDYVLLIIGQRKEAFYPSIAYKILLDIIQNIGEQFELIISDMNVNDTINMADELEVFKIFSSARGLISHDKVDQVVQYFNSIENKKLDKESQLDKLSKYLKTISDTTKEGKKITDSAIGVKDNVEQIFSWLSTLVQ